MSQTFFSKQDVAEKHNRLNGIASVGGEITLWVKGTKDKKNIKVHSFDKERSALVLDTKDNVFPLNSSVLCNFEYRGMSFFSEVIFQKSIADFAVVVFSGNFYKSERRNSYRLMTFPQFQIWCEIDLGTSEAGGKVIGFKNRVSQTGIFKSFLNLVKDSDNSLSNTGILALRVQDLSTTGMAIHIGEMETAFIKQDSLFENVTIRIESDVITIPKVKVMYIGPYIGRDKNLKQYKVGLHFENLSTVLDEALGKKINQLLRLSDHNKDFETFIK